MIFRQLFDSVSGTYSYLLASRAGGEALILDPVLEKVDRYCQLLRELDLRLVKAVDTIERETGKRPDFIAAAIPVQVGVGQILSLTENGYTLVRP